MGQNKPVLLLPSTKGALETGQSSKVCVAPARRRPHEELVVDLTPTVFDVRVRVDAQTLVGRLCEHCEKYGESLDQTVGNLREDKDASLAAELQSVTADKARSHLDGLVDELLSGIGKPLPSPPKDVAVRFDTALRLHAARLAKLDHGSFS